MVLTHRTCEFSENSTNSHLDRNQSELERIEFSQTVCRTFIEMSEQVTVKQEIVEEERIMTAALGLSALANGGLAQVSKLEDKDQNKSNCESSGKAAEKVKLPNDETKTYKHKVSAALVINEKTDVKSPTETNGQEDSNGSNLSEKIDSHSHISSSGYSSRSESSDLDSPVPERVRSSLPPKKRRSARQKVGEDGEPVTKMKSYPGALSSSPTHPQDGAVFVFPRYPPKCSAHEKRMSPGNNIALSPNLSLCMHSLIADIGR